MPIGPADEAALARGLARLGSHAAYAEVLAESTGGHLLRHDKTATTPEPLARMEGAVFRAWTGEKWTEAAASGFQPHALDAAIETLLPRLTGGGRGPPGESAQGSLERTTEERRPVAEFGLEERLELARTWFGWATEIEGVGNAIISLGHTDDDRLFLTSEGARRRQRLVRTRGTVVPIAIEGARVEYDFDTRGRLGGAELFDEFTEESVKAVARESKALLAAPAPPVGRMAVVLDPGTAGTFAHESFGHGTEADQLLRDRSYLKPLLGETVGPESVTLVDDGAHPTGWGSIFFDDDGRPSQRTVLVDRGRFVEVLHDRESAAAMGRRPTGNCRRADFLSRPFVRMTNTYVEPGDWTLEELLQEAKDGVLLESCTSGIEDPLGGNMQIKVKKGHRIEHGERAGIVTSMALSGRVLEFLRSIRGVGRRDDFSIAPGYCGKGHTDLLPAGTGGAYLLAEAVVGPA
ncbi:MAG TPA: TldD/PmbA family protein [Thermoplasmata archaeon]|nr:TldD/PmbA family protein [Thermoplasmata archaeon]